jgi:hypothetical protein
LLATGVPTNIAGWGPREGVTARAFGAAGLGADRGLSTAVVYGVLVLVASLPGAAVLVVAWIRRYVAGRARDGTSGRPGRDEPTWRPVHDGQPVCATRMGPGVRVERVEPIRWLTPATAEPKGATRG